MPIASKRLKLKLLLITTIFATHIDSNAESHGGFNSLQLVSTTIKQFPSCIEYTIRGISLRMQITPAGPYFFWTPNISHRSPDFISMSHPTLDAIPYVEYSLLLGTVYKKVSEIIFLKPAQAIFGLGGTQIGGGRYQYANWAEHQSVQFTESTVIGNPVAMLLDAFRFDGLHMPEIQDSHEPMPTQADVGRWLKSWASNSDTQWPPIFSEFLQYKKIMQVIERSPIVQEIKNLTAEIDVALQSVGGRVGNYPFCIIDSTPFEPYYLSGIDSWMWRMGYPISDPEKSSTILNPFSDDTIKPSNQNESALVELPSALNSFLTASWGNIYPREGALDQPDGAKLATVIAARSMDLIAENSKPVGRLYRNSSKVKDGAWASVYPKSNTQCHTNIANTGQKINLSEQYAWNYWPTYRCDLYGAGVRIAFVPIGPIHITPAVPE